MLVHAEFKITTVVSMMHQILHLNSHLILTISQEELINMNSILSESNDQTGSVTFLPLQVINKVNFPTQAHLNQYPIQVTAVACNLSNLPFLIVTNQTPLQNGAH